MKNNDDVFAIKLGETEIKLEIDQMAIQANGAVRISSAGTVVLVTVVMDDKLTLGANFVPLRVDYEERFYAARQIMGSRYNKREGRPSDEAILTSRVIDRSIRPFFPRNLRQSVHVVATVLALGDTDPDVLAILGSSTALHVSSIPWIGPVAPVRVSLTNNGESVVNPLLAQRADLKAEVLATGQKELVHMIEFVGEELPEGETAEMLAKAISEFDSLCAWQDKIQKKVGKDKEGILETPSEEEDSHKEKLGLQEKMMKGWRPDGRNATEVRPISIKTGVIDNLHGSCEFSRGETRVLSVTTLAAPTDALLIEGMEVHGEEKFIHHYNFPPFATGKAGRIGSPGRREIGHGFLAYRAIRGVMPKESDYPYTVRTVAEVLSSNGSSSMASTCASSMSLANAGVPIKELVSGIAIGLIANEDLSDYIILTDIQGEEDHLGLMDFKIAGTTEGLTVMQLDVKNHGVSLKILTESLAQGQSARLKILDQMKKALTETDNQHPESAPLIIPIPHGHIGRIIGRGGANIKSLEEKTGTNISIEQDRYAVISGDKKSKAVAIKKITADLKDYSVGDKFDAVVKEFLPYGAIVEIDTGREALLHVSELKEEYVEAAQDLIKIGDSLPVTIVEASSDGRLKVSVKDKHPDYFNK